MVIDKLMIGQVWSANDGSGVVVICDIHGNYGVVGSDREMSLGYLNQNFTYIGQLKDNWITRSRSATETQAMRHMLRMQADKMHAQGQKMLDDATKLREAADLLEA